MISSATFSNLMDDVVRAHFPESRLAYSEVKQRVVKDLYEGRTDEYITEPKGSQQADFEFADTILALAPSAISVLTITRVAAEAFLAIRRAIAPKTDTAVTAETANKPTLEEASKLLDSESLHKELLQRLGLLLTSEKALEVTGQLVASLTKETSNHGENKGTV